MPSLVVVESPAKAKTISRILGDGYVVEASYGHIRDLPEKAEHIPPEVKKEPWARLGVNVEDGFEPLYIVPEDKKKHVKRLRQAAAKADELLLATDEDREGESISWHVVQVLDPKIPIRRIAFHEITRDAVLEAVENPRAIDEDLVRAQESRRILDRLYGYKLSPVLWKKVRRGLSAGRVQSVAVRLCVMRERERRAFHTARYFDAEAVFAEPDGRFTARLVRVDGRRVATGSDFDPDTGSLSAKAQRASGGVLWLSREEQVRELIDALDRPWSVVRVEQKPFTRRPAPPFTTSSLQQEANRKLGFSAQRTMRIAQRLYEGIDLDGERVGLITYMRTDSVTLSNKALEDAQRVIRDKYGAAYTTGPRRYKTKSASAQEAHEAIRPTEIARTPEALARYLDADERKLYELIWKRTLASQMADARLKSTQVEIRAPIAGGREAIFAASGKTIEFSGFLRAYVEGSDDPAAEIADQEVTLPPLSEGQTLEPETVEPKAHETPPPPRYTEASLVKKLEAEGIGRPSTYASIIDTIQQRGYIVKQKNQLVPTFTAFAVTELLEKHFPDYVDIRFTAKMERDLDEIACGRIDYREHLARFYLGSGDDDPGLEKRIEREEPRIEYPEIPLGTHPRTGEPVVVKVGRWGPYIQTGSGESRQMASVPAGIAPADLTIEKAVELLDKKSEGPRRLGTDPETGLDVYVIHGRYGAYVQLGETPDDKNAPKPKRASLPKGMSEEEATLDLALKLLSLPRTVGVHPETGAEIIATNGRYGPFLKCGDETRSLDDENQIFTITLDEAVRRLAEPKRGRARQRARKVLAELGTDPASGLAVQVLDGPYGPYITNGELNASVPEGVDPAALELAQAVEILAEKGKAPRRRAAKKKAAKKKAAKKKAAKAKATKTKAAKAQGLKKRSAGPRGRGSTGS